MQERYAFLASQWAFFRQPVVILDLEATGGDLYHDRITEIAFLRFDGAKIQRFSQLVNPEQIISPFIEDLTGIRNAMVHDAPTFAMLLPEILPLLRGAILVAHNSHFDYTLLRNECARAGVVFASAALCSVKLSKNLYPHESKHNLDAIAERFQLVAQGERHRAWSDVMMLADFLQAACREHAETWFETASRLLQPQCLPAHLPDNLREQVVTFPDTAGVLCIERTDGAREWRVCEHLYQEMVNYLRAQKDFQMIETLSFRQAVGVMDAVVVYAIWAEEMGVAWQNSGRYTIIFHEQAGCLKASVKALKNGFYDAPPTGLFLHPKAAKRAVLEWAKAYEICLTRLGALPYSLPKGAPCPAAVATACVCEHSSEAHHNAVVRKYAPFLPTVDWSKTACMRLYETDKVSGQVKYFMLERGALRLDDGRWFVHEDLLNIIKMKLKKSRKLSEYGNL